MEKLLKERNITSLCHFTQAANLESIFRYGLLSRKALVHNAITAEINDPYRWDGCLDAVSTSIMFPNYKMFYTLRMQNTMVDWAILEIDASIMLNAGCAFNWTNAADSTVSSIPIADRMTTSAFSGLFTDKAGYPQRSTLNIPDCYPTNPQAEVLVFSDIGVDDIVGVYFEKKEVADRYLSIIPQNIQVYIEPGLYFGRNDWSSWK